MPPNQEATQILTELARGDRSAAERLLPHVYEQLRALAASFFQRQPGDHTLQPTALVHEAYVKLVGSGSGGWENKKHFFDVAAMAMRQLLTDHARRRAAAKHGGNAERITLSDADGTDSGPINLDVEALDAALTKLAALDHRQARIVELRYLAGLTSEQTGEVLG
ncbi:MAG: ECF-type sigma factor, partial [Phycisphaerae bacterium]